MIQLYFPATPCVPAYRVYEIALNPGHASVGADPYLGYVGGSGPSGAENRIMATWFEPLAATLHSSARFVSEPFARRRLPSLSLSARENFLARDRVSKVGDGFRTCLFIWRSFMANMTPGHFNRRVFLGGSAAAVAVPALKESGARAGGLGRS